MDNTQQIVSAITNPYILALVIPALIAVQAAYSNPKSSTKWLFVTLFCYLASLTSPAGAWYPDPPVLAFPLQTLRQFGRVEAVGALILLAAVSFVPIRRPDRTHIPRPILFLYLFQVFILLKTMISGSASAAFLLLIILGLTMIVHTYGVRRWLVSSTDFDHAIKAIVWIGIIFIVTNLYQIAIDPFPVTFMQGWFMGTTGNPHHAAILLGGMIPAYLYLIMRPRTRFETSLHLMFFSAFFALTSLALVWTSSRGGLLATLTALCYLFRNKLGRLLKIAFIFMLLYGIYAMVFKGDSLNLSNILDPITHKMEQNENTRAEVWSQMWSNFVANPFFGAPVEGERIRYKESSWLGAVSAGGLLGLVLMLLFLAGVLSMIKNLYHISNHNRQLHLKAEVVNTALIFFLIFSVFEAFLLGNITVMINLVFIYVTLGAYLVDEHRKMVRK